MTETKTEKPAALPLDLGNLLMELQTIPDEMERQMTKLQLERHALDDWRMDLRLAEAAIAAKVAMAKGEDGKPIFGNEQARKAAIEDGCRKDPVHLKAESEVRQSEIALAGREARIERLKLEHRSCLALMGYFTALAGMPRKGGIGND
jgi:hypothetical protein